MKTQKTSKKEIVKLKKNIMKTNNNIKTLDQLLNEEYG